MTSLRAEAVSDASLQIPMPEITHLSNLGSDKCSINKNIFKILLNWQSSVYYEISKYRKFNFKTEDKGKTLR